MAFQNVNDYPFPQLPFLIILIDEKFINLKKTDNKTGKSIGELSSQLEITEFLARKGAMGPN